MRRRECLALLCGSIAWPAPSHGQDRVRVVGVLTEGSFETFSSFLDALREGLGQTGFAEARNLRLDTRWAEGESKRLPELAQALMNSGAELLIGAGRPATLALQKVAAGLPIVFYIANDPVQVGLADSLARPGRNLTGFTGDNTILNVKRAEILAELIPDAANFFLLIDPGHPHASSENLANMRAATTTLRRNLVIVQAASDPELEGVFLNLPTQGSRALLVANSSFFNPRLFQIASLALKARMPTMYSEREFTQAGGLLSYGLSKAGAYRDVGVYAGRILNGESPANLPVLQPIKRELVVNLRTAKQLGVSVSEAFLLRADEVIE